MKQNDKRKKVVQRENGSAMIEIPFHGYCENFEHFFEKRVNEEFAAKVLQSVFRFQSVKHGQDGTEADLIFDEEYAFEITLICDKKKHNNLIQRVLKVYHKLEQFHSDDIQGEVLSMIDSCIEKKDKKRYANQPVNLCLISPFPMFSWIDGSMDEMELLFVTPKSRIFDFLFEKYVKTKIFGNIYILLPDIDKSWWIIDLKGKRRQYKGNIADKNYPYFSETKW